MKLIGLLALGAAAVAPFAALAETRTVVTHTTVHHGMMRNHHRSQTCSMRWVHGHKIKHCYWH